MRAATRRCIDIADRQTVPRLARLLVELAQNNGKVSPDQRGIIIGSV
jgi:hypothetical protein